MLVVLGCIYANTPIREEIMPVFCLLLYGGPIRALHLVVVMDFEFGLSYLDTGGWHYYSGCRRYNIAR